LNIQVAAINYNDKPTPSLELETGVKWTTSFLENRLNFEEVLNGELVSNPFFKNNFLMDENIYAAYVSAGWNIAKQLQFKGGLRYEYYQIDLNSSKDGDVLHRKNGRLYPNLFLKYSLSENADLNLSYSERVERPGFLILAPFFYFFDQFTLLTGNPTIIPTISKRIKFDMRYKTFNLNDRILTMKPAYILSVRSRQRREIPYPSLPAFLFKFPKNGVVESMPISTGSTNVQL